MKLIFTFTVCMWAALGQTPAAGPTPREAVDRLLDKIVERERAFVASMKKRTPLVETYIQETPGGASDDALPAKDHYFLGRIHVGGGLTYDSLVERTDAAPKQSGRFLHLGSSHLGMARIQPVTFLPRGFAQMAFVDLTDFNRKTYRFEYVRREFLGEVRCLVFDVSPVAAKDPGRFTGRIWVEDRDNSIVRFDGIYTQPSAQGRDAGALLPLR